MREYRLEKRAHLGPCMDIRVHQGRLWVIQNARQAEGGRLAVLSPAFELLHEYKGIGNARQIEISGRIAIVTARENGLWIFDISQGAPRLLSHYHTIEYATGAALYSHWALISCRQFGVEIIDIAEPEAPRHVGIIRIGEVQSACVYEGFLYGGVWGEMQVAVVDIRDLSSPRLVGRIPLEGRGDGVFAWEGRLYAVTGQHQRGIRNISDEGDPCFGMGNGLSVFDLSHAGEFPEICRKFFGKSYNMFCDMWKPQLCEGLLLCNCSSLGVFAYDRDTLSPLFHWTLPEEQDAVTSVATLGQTVYVCSDQTDLYAFDAGRPLGTCLRWDGTAKESGKSAAGNLSVHGKGLSLIQRYRPESSPVLALSPCCESLAAACGNDGIHLLRADGEILALHAVCPTPGFCCDLSAGGKILCAALAEKGIAIYGLEGEKLCPIASLPTEKAALQLHLSPDGRHLLAGLGTQKCVLYDLSGPSHPALLASYENRFPLYGGNFAAHSLEDGAMLAFWHRAGLIVVHPELGSEAFRAISYHRSIGFTGFGPGSGCDTDGKHILYTIHGGYVFLPVQEGVNVDDLPVFRAEEPMQGKITLCGNYLAATERAEGSVALFDVADIQSPRFLGRCDTSASPGRAVLYGGRMLIPATHGGILEICPEKV